MNTLYIADWTVRLAKLVWLWLITTMNCQMLACSVMYSGGVMPYSFFEAPVEVNRIGKAV